jgi:hypothetical protein
MLAPVTQGDAMNKGVFGDAMIPAFPVDKWLR